VKLRTGIVLFLNLMVIACMGSPPLPFPLEN
jgi:hypothetical protein